MTGPFFLVVLLSCFMVVAAMYVLSLMLDERKHVLEAYQRSETYRREDAQHFVAALQSERELAAKNQEALAGRLIETCEKMVSYARFDLDAAERALKMQKIIDDRVKERTVTIVVDQEGRVVRGSQKNAPAGEQPPDPNVKTSTILDEVTELEREMSRIIKDDIPYEKRDSFYPEQPRETVM